MRIECSPKSNIPPFFKQIRPRWVLILVDLLICFSSHNLIDCERHRSLLTYLEFFVQNKLPRNYTLSDLLALDPVGTLYRQMGNDHEAFIAAHKEAHGVFLSVIKAKGALRESSPEQFAAVQQLDANTETGKAEIARILGISAETIAQAQTHLANMIRATSAPAHTLIRSWRALKARANIADLAPEDFPFVLTRPMLTLYSADWCPPCRVMRPTFARLVPFFDKAEVRYCHDDELQKDRGVQFIPQFVASFPNGAEVSSHVPATTQGIWDTMNNLIVLGKNWEGKGELSCTDEKCEIVLPGTAP